MAAVVAVVAAVTLTATPVVEVEPGLVLTSTTPSSALVHLPLVEIEALAIVEAERIAAELAAQAEAAALAEAAAAAERSRQAPPPLPQPAAPLERITSMEPCGGDLPPCYVKQRESGGNYQARNPSGACGAWQIIPSTWAGYAGYSSACDAPPSVQDDKARQLWAGGAGCGHWSAC